VQNEQTNQVSAEELIPAFARCPNYPRDMYGLQALADGLRKASVDHGVSMRRIVEACLEISRYCPTDSELSTIAHNLSVPDRIAEEERRDREWHREMQRTYGAPKPFVPDWDMASVKAYKAREGEMYKRIRQHLGTHMGKFPDGRRVT